jgi:hypothetical protein
MAVLWLYRRSARGTCRFRPKCYILEGTGLVWAQLESAGRGRKRVSPRLGMPENAGVVAAVAELAGFSGDRPVRSAVSGTPTGLSYRSSVF